CRALISIQDHECDRRNHGDENESGSEPHAPEPWRGRGCRLLNDWNRTRVRCDGGRRGVQLRSVQQPVSAPTYQRDVAWLLAVVAERLADQLDALGDSLGVHHT